MTDKWVLTWVRTAFVTFGRKNGPSFRENIRGFCNIKVYPLRSRAGRGDRPE